MYDLNDNTEYPQATYKQDTIHYYRLPLCNEDDLGTKTEYTDYK